MIRSTIQRVGIRSLSTSSPQSAPLPVTSGTSSALPKLYPFATNVRILPPLPTPPPKTDSLLRTLNAHLTSLTPNSTTLLPLFSRRSPIRLLPGSVLTVSTYTSIPTPSNPSPSLNTFSGVLIALRRRHAGRDTSFRLRNLVGRTGVEVAYKVFSPLIANIKIVSRATFSGPKVIDRNGVEGQRKKPTLRASKRAKMYFVRDQPNRLVGVGGIVKQQREREEKEAALLNKRR